MKKTNIKSSSHIDVQAKEAWPYIGQLYLP